LFVILANGGYAVLDRLAERHGGAPAWPSFSVDVAAVARGLGCPAHRVESHDDIAHLDDAVRTLATRREPLLLEVVVEPDPTFAP